MNTPPAIFPPSPNRKQASRAKPRTPLQERTQSQTNEDSTRLGRDGRRDQTGLDMSLTTPFPTKPQHVLLPSTIRKQRSYGVDENLFSNFVSRSQPNLSSRPSTSGHNEPLDDSTGRRAPVLQLKRSVTTLRDMYEAQADTSRPSTAASFTPRPGTANSRLRSASSSEGLSGRRAWERLHKISADDLALLPTMERPSLENLASESSFASRAAKSRFLTSSPNYQTYGSSSPKIPSHGHYTNPLSDGIAQSSSSGLLLTSSSSPNFVRLGRSSSIAETLNTEQSSSSPNFVKLGTSSPGLRNSSSPTPSMASDGSRKRKRAEEEQRDLYAARNRRYSSSPPYAVVAASSSEPSLRSPESGMPSSPPRLGSAHSQSIGTSSPVYRLPGTTRQASSSSSSSSAHASLQAALSSSPMPPIQYPVIRAPVAAASTLNVPKRLVRNSSAESSGPWISRLSPVPSEWDEGLSRSGSKKTQEMDRFEESSQRSNSITPEPTGNESQVRIISIPDDDHQHEATDELRALPRARGPLAHRSPPIVPIRTNSLFGTTSSSSGNHSQSRLNSLRTSLDTRLNSMRSYSHSRQNSFVSGSLRPSSSGSQSTSIIVPTWARRYYSGIYRDSFQYLYPTQTNSAAQLPVPLNNQADRTTSMTSGLTQPNSSTVTSPNRRRSWQSISQSFRNSMMGYIPTVLIPKDRPRLEARKSHLMAGMGPLVSNPVHPEAAYPRMDPHRENSTVRRVSDQLPPADPRAHWAGVIDEQSMHSQYFGSTPYHSSRQINRHSAGSDSVYYDAISGHILRRSRLTDVPHLHHDRRLNTGSSKSRGFGFPFNKRSRYQAPSVYDASTRPSWLHVDLRDAQVTCFIVGFVFPLTWFVAVFLPLPRRPDSFEDIEKAMSEQQPNQGGDWEDLDIVARLRLERYVRGVEELKWQNARWWQRMNKWMCLVGLVVFVLVIVLAVIGTRNHW